MAAKGWHARITSRIKLAIARRSLLLQIASHCNLKNRHLRFEEFWENNSSFASFPLFVIKRVIIAFVFLALGGVFFLQKQHEKKAALELRKKHEEAVAKAQTAPSPASSSIKGLPKPTPTPVLGPAPTSKPKPTPILPKPTPMLKQTP
jgi:hypothetical protein